MPFPGKYKIVYQHVKKEFFTYLDVNADFVGGQVKRADYYLKQGDLQKGIEGYEKASQIDNINNNVRLDLANLYYRNQEFKKSEEAYKTVILQELKYGPAYYSLGLLYAEMERTDEAIDQMQKANRLMPENIRIYYNLGLLYDKIQEVSKAEKTLINGLEVDSSNESLLYALAFHYYNVREIEKSKNILMKLVQLFPNNIQYKNFLNNLN